MSVFTWFTLRLRTCQEPTDEVSKFWRLFKSMGLQVWHGLDNLGKLENDVLQLQLPRRSRMRNSSSYPYQGSGVPSDVRSVW